MSTLLELDGARARVCVYACLCARSASTAARAGWHVTASVRLDTIDPGDPASKRIQFEQDACERICRLLGCDGDRRVKLASATCRLEFGRFFNFHPWGRHSGVVHTVTVICRRT